MSNELMLIDELRNYNGERLGAVETVRRVRFLKLESDILMWSGAQCASVGLSISNPYTSTHAAAAAIGEGTPTWWVTFEGVRRRQCTACARRTLHRTRVPR